LAVEDILAIETEQGQLDALMASLQLKHGLGGPPWGIVHAAVDDAVMALSWGENSTMRPFPLSTRSSTYTMIYQMCPNTPAELPAETYQYFTDVVKTLKVAHDLDLGIDVPYANKAVCAIFKYLTRYYVPTNNLATLQEVWDASFL
jgi:hypothetical protein